MRPDRRAMLGGLAAALVAGGPRDAADPAAALDEAAILPPAEGLARLAGFVPAALPPGRRLDLVTARAGLAIDARLALLPGTGGAAKGYRPAAGAAAITPEHYALLLSRTLGPVSPRAAQARLTQVLGRLHARAAAGFAAIGDRTGGIGDRYRRLWQDDRYRYADEAAAVADMARLLALARTRVAGQIGAVPHWCTDVFVRSLTPAEVAAGRAGYRIVPAPDRQGGYVVDLKQLARRPRWTLPSVVAHELLPGHMIQLGLEAIDPPHPLRIAYAASFVEGWGVHAETLAAADGAFADPRALLGHLHWLIFRVARALVDIGIHLDRWSIDAARARLVDWQGEPAYFAPFDTELARIAQEPATRVAEAMAWLAIDDATHGRGAARIARQRRLLVHGRMRSDAVGNIS